MPTQQADAKPSEANSKDSLFKAKTLGLTFRGLITSVDQVKEWKDYNTGKVLGLQCAVGLTDKTKIYTHTLRVDTGQTMPELQFGDEVMIFNAGCQSDKGQHRLTGDLIQQ